MSSPLIDRGRAALRDGDAASARRAFGSALAEAESGEALEGLAEALYLERKYAAAAALARGRLCVASGQGAPGTDDAPVAYGPRRTVLDKLLVDAAAEAGAEVREGFTVTEVVAADGRVSGVRGRGRRGQGVTTQARVVVGADGRHSAVARAVGPEQYHERPPLLCDYQAFARGFRPSGRR